MLGEAAAPLGVNMVVSDPTPACPATPVVDGQIVGGFDDYDTLHELAEHADVLTYEIELADPAMLTQVSDETGTPVHPDPATLQTIQDKLVQNQLYAEADIPTPEFRQVDNTDDLRAAGEELGWPVMLKARQGGYDGRGNLPCEDPHDAEAALAQVGGGNAVAERMVPFERELAVIGCRGPDGIDTFPVTETIQREEVLRESVSPARTDEATLQQADAMAREVLAVLDGRGVYGIELFDTDGAILVNEVAPRPHNSGHWTIEGCDVSQFEQHIRAVMGLPLGSTRRRSSTVSANILGNVDEPQEARLHGVEEALLTPRLAMHWYGKSDVRPLRKMGHITLTGNGNEDVEQLLSQARSVREKLSFQ
jgi:5-(carboxyamino)imidazole ribonucleotide synthase